MSPIWWRNTPVDIAALNLLGQGSLHEHLGIEFMEAGDRWLKARMPVDARTRQPHGLLHGGASVVLAESVASIAGSLTVDPETSRVVGLEINANHLRPVTEGHVCGVATAEALGRRTQVWTIRITNDESRMVCLSRITLAVVAHEREG